MANIYEGTLELIGHTPLVEFKHIEKKFGLEARLLAKLEYFNPAGSVKDQNMPRGAAVQTKKQSKSFFSICSVSLTISDFFAFLPFSHKIHPEIFDPSHIVEIICRS